MAFKDFFKKATGKTLYFAGPLTRELQQKEFENNLQVFKKLDIDIITLGKENTTGIEAYHAGYTKEAKAYAEKNHELFKKKRIYKIITSDPESYHTFKSLYPKWVDNWQIEVEHTTQTILKALKKKKITSNKEEKEKVSYHDPCSLSRWEGIIEEPREIITLLGGELLEATKSKDNAMCCGAGGGVLQNYPKEARLMAKQRISQFPEEIKKIITPAGICFASLSKEEDKVIEFSTFVLGKLRGLGF
jgi:Fe-S oxidoreductase